jgi:F-type H+-transporting ATPase subunit gamma
VATQRDIRKRIQSVSNTKKITRTMEMVATAKMKKMSDKLHMSQPYAEKLNKIILHLRESGLEGVMDPLIQERPDPHRVMVLTITGDRGLCGGFNINVIENTMSFKERLTIEEGREVLLYVIGKKAINYFRFIGEPMYNSLPNFEDKLTFEDAAVLGDELIELFVSGELDEVYVSYTQVITTASQKPAITRLLPIAPETREVDQVSPEFYVQYIFEPNPFKIFSSLLPLYIKVRLYLYQLESSYSEQFARRVAMKNATDAATEMIKELTVSYNRARQDKITREIAEIVGGAAALE